MANARPIRVDIVGNARGLSATVDIANAKLSAMSKTAMQASAATDRLQRNMDRANVAMAAAAGAAGAGIVFKQLADSAGAAQTATLSLQAVFKGQADQMKAAASSANEVGMSYAQYGQNATRLGAQLQNMGFDMEAAGVTTQQLIKHAADLSAVFGGDATQAIEAMSAVFRKELDPIEKYGFTMKASELESRAAAEGITYGQAAIQAIMEQTGYAMGAFERNADSYNVQMQKMTAATEDAKADIGEALLPVFATVAEGVSGVAGVLKAIPDGVQSALSGLALLGGALKLATLATGAATARLYAYEAALMQTRGASSLTALSVGVLGTQMERAGRGAKVFGALMIAGLAADQLLTFNDTADETAATLRELAASGLTDGVKTNLEGIAGYMNTLADPTLNDRMNAFAGTLFNVFGFSDTSRNRTIDALKEFDSQLTQMATSGNAEAAAAAFRQLAAAAQAQGIPIEEVTNLMPQYTAATEGAAQATQAVTDKAAASAAAFKAASDAASELRDALAALGQENVDLDLAQAAYKETLAQFNAEVKKGAGISANTEGGRANLRGLVDIREATLDVIKAQDQAGQSGDALERTMKRGRDAFIAAAEAAGVGSEKAKQLARDYGLIPGSVKTTLSAEDAAARAKIIALKAQLATMAASVYTTTLQVQISTSGSTPRGVPSPTGPTQRALAAYAAAGQTRAGSSLSGGKSLYQQFRDQGLYAGKAFNAGWMAGVKDLTIGTKGFAQLGDKARETARDAWSKILDKGEKQYDRLYDKLERREKRLKELSDERADYIKATAERVSAFSISDALRSDTTTVKSWDHLDGILEQLRAATSPGEIARLQGIYEQAIAAGPREIAVGVQSIGDRLREQVAKTSAFAANLTKLKAAGFTQAQLQELINAGADAGGEMAAALVADPNLASTYQSAFDQMTQAAKDAGVAMVPDSLTAGIKAAEGNIRSAKKELRTFWDDFKKTAPVKLGEVMKLRVEVIWDDGTTTASGPKKKTGGSAKAAGAPLIGGDLIINGAVDKEGTARSLETVLTQHARRMGY